MALRRTSLSLRSLFSIRSYQPTYSCIIHHEQKPNYHLFSSSMLSQHLIGSSHLSLCPVSIYHRSMSTSQVPSSEVNDVAATLSTNSVTTRVTKVGDAAKVSSVLSDLGQHLIDRMHCFIELNWWISTIPTVIVFQGFLTPLFILMKTEDIDQRNKVKFWEDPMKPSKW
ncbi:putative F-box/LRR-repeat protein [Cardamine amara subsp. amara]|uniref:F-box/LRR-repeat protein n=1 Tax=Cardamine amara subsp. amara TaxID=228776 RepID=A0ABD1BJB5_CARAN